MVGITPKQILEIIEARHAQGSISLTYIDKNGETRISNIFDCILKDIFALLVVDLKDTEFDVKWGNADVSYFKTMNREQFRMSHDVTLQALNYPPAIVKEFTVARDKWMPLKCRIANVLLL